MAVQKPKGTVDFYPEELAVRSKLFDLLRQQALRYNFKEIESPAFENLSFLTKKEGEEIVGQIFSLEKRGDEQFGLRFDLTVPAARMFIEKQKSLPKPVKWFYLSRMWRYEQPQAGRLREFYQMSCEIFGSSKPEADAELLNLIIDCLASLGLTKNDFFIKINNRKLLEGLLLDIVDKNQTPDVIRIIDKRAKISQAEFNNELRKLGQEPEKIVSVLQLTIDDLQDSKLTGMAQEGLNELRAVFSLLKERKDFLKLDLSTARGLAYYTGTVFEVFDSQGKYRALAGGGRYDNLVELFGGQSTPATGFAIGYATLSLYLKEKGLLPEITLNPDYFVAILNEEVKQEALSVVRKLRKKYTVETDLMARNLGNQLKYANTIGTKKLIVIGPEELKERRVNIKDMKTGKEEKKEINKLIS